MTSSTALHTDPPDVASPDSDDAVLVVRDLRVSFHANTSLVPVVRGVDFELHPGKTLGIVGESGSGKSVTCLALMGLLPRARTSISGDVRLGERHLLHMSERELQDVRGKKMGMIFQDPMTSLNPFMRVGRQLSEMLEVHEGLSRRQAKRRALELMERVGIPDTGARYQHHPHQFSGGMRQRLMIAMALLTRPKVLIADEPTTALDVTIQAQILELIRGLAADFGTAVLFITHDLGVVAGIADEVMVMYAGRAVEKAPVRQLFASPQHPYTRGLLQAVPKLYEGGPLIAIPGAPPQPHALPSGCAFRPRCRYAHDGCAEDIPPPVHTADGRMLACPVVEKAPFPTLLDDLVPTTPPPVQTSLDLDDDLHALPDEGEADAERPPREFQDDDPEVGS